MLIFLIFLYYIIATALSFIYSHLLSTTGMKYPIMFSGLTCIWQVVLSATLIKIREKLRSMNKTHNNEVDMDVKTIQDDVDTIENSLEDIDKEKQSEIENKICMEQSESVFDQPIHYLNQFDKFYKMQAKFLSQIQEKSNLILFYEENEVRKTNNFVGELNPFLQNEQKCDIQNKKSGLSKLFSNPWLHLLPCTISGMLDIILSTISLQNVTLALYTMIKSSSPIFILLSSFLINNEPVSFKSFFIILIIGIGTFFLTYKKCNSYDIYSVLTLISTAVSGIRWSFIQKYLRKERSFLHFIRHVNLGISIKLILYSLMFEINYENTDDTNVISIVKTEHSPEMPYKEEAQSNKSNINSSGELPEPEFVQTRKNPKFIVLSTKNPANIIENTKLKTLIPGNQVISNNSLDNYQKDASFNQINIDPSNNHLKLVPKTDLNSITSERLKIPAYHLNNNLKSNLDENINIKSHKKGRENITIPQNIIPKGRENITLSPNILPEGFPSFSKHPARALVFSRDDSPSNRQYFIKKYLTKRKNDIFSNNLSSWLKPENQKNKMPTIFEVFIAKSMSKIDHLISVGSRFLNSTKDLLTDKSISLLSYLGSNSVLTKFSSVVPFLLLTIALSSASFLLILVEFSILKSYSSVFLSILGIFKELTIIILSTCFFKSIDLNQTNWAGLVVSLFGLVLYAVFKGSK